MDEWAYRASARNRSPAPHHRDQETTISASSAAPSSHLQAVAAAAERLGITTSKLQELVAKQVGPSVGIGRAFRISQHALARPASSPGPAEPTTHRADAPGRCHVHTHVRADLVQDGHASRSSARQAPASPILLEALGKVAIDDGLTVAWFDVESLGRLVTRHRADDTVAKAINRVLSATSSS